MKNLNLISSLLFACVLSISCSKKGAEEFRLTPSTSSTSSDVVGVSANGSRSVSSGSQTQALATGAAAGVKMEWIASEKPVLTSTSKGQKYYQVVNVVRYNGKDYNFPTVHPSSNKTPIIADTSYFTMDGVDFDLDGECLDSNCSEYALSIQVSKSSQQVQQLMVYMDFQNRLQPLVALNDKFYFMNFSQFYDLIRKYYNS